MALSAWIRWMNGKVLAKRCVRKRQIGRCIQLQLECLEHRCVPATLTLLSNASSGSANSSYAVHFPGPPPSTEQDSEEDSGSHADGSTRYASGAVSIVTDSLPEGAKAQIHAVAVVEGPGYSNSKITFEGDGSANASATLEYRIVGDEGEPDNSPVIVNVPVSGYSEPAGGNASISVSLQGFNPVSINGGSSVDQSWDLRSRIGSTFSVQLSAEASAESEDMYHTVRTGGHLTAAMTVTPITCTPDSGGSYEITEGDSLQLDASNTLNPHELPLTYSWDINRDGTWINDVANGQKPTLGAGKLKDLGITPGNSPYQVKVEVTDQVSGFTWISEPTNLTVDPAPTDLVASSLTWDAKTGGVQCKYTITGTAPTQPVNVRFSWASGTTLATAMRNITLQSLPTDFSVSAQQFGQPPAGAKFLLMELDWNHQITESKENNNLLPLAFNPKIESITAKYSISGNTQSIGRFFSGVPLNGQVFNVTLNDDLAAVRPSKVTLTVGSGKLVLTPQSGTGAWDGKTYLSAAYDGTGGLAPKTYQLTAAAQVGNTTAASNQIGMDVVGFPKWLTPGQNTHEFDPQTKTYVFAVSLFKVSSSMGTQFALPGASKTWFAASAKSGLDAQVSFQATTGFDPTKPPNVTGQVKAQLSVLGQSIYSYVQSYQSLQNSGKFGAAVNLDPRTLNVNSATFTYTDGGSKPLSFDSQPIKKPPFMFSYHLQTTLIYTASLQITLNKNGTLNAGQSSIDFTVHADPLSGNLTITDITLGPLFGNKVLSVLTNALKGVPGLVGSPLIGALQDVGLIPSFSASADVTGTLDLKGHAGLGGALLNLGLTQPKLTGSIKLTVPAVKISFTWLGETKDLGSISLGTFLDVKLP